MKRPEKKKILPYFMKLKKIESSLGKIMAEPDKHVTLRETVEVVVEQQLELIIRIQEIEKKLESLNISEVKDN